MYNHTFHKTYFRLCLCLGFSLVFLFAGCDTKCLKVPGKTVQLRRESQPFQALSQESFSPVRILFSKSNATYLELSGAKNVLSHVQTRYQDQTLNVGVDIPRCDHLTQREIVLHCPLQPLLTISHAGYAPIEFRDTLQTSTLDVVLSDQGDLNLPLVADRLNISISRTANATVSGSINQLNVHTTSDVFAPSLSYGRFQGKLLQTKNCTVLLEGEGDCEVNVSDTLQVTITGVGNVIYYGTPKVIKSSITGAGKLIQGK